ncbi:MFS transporter [Brevibacterium sp. SMBL_HHYL_HB1]|uniref:MFS transporter n=1 Tax=Brevibacterium sp. SMBL_HHYL_HB1 TaxID=2777556 RepID=UPI001BAA284A|nr:MFS transporter [Brevibacterium sp. SMBL_HHYL_HB1]QUL77886.1 MHS family MFS transporter [Brevibacterium sp. SMBL_HHYL_HB1]
MTSSTSTKKPVSLNRIGMSSFIGTTMEWYDFFIYSTAAALVFDQLFFPSFEPLIGSILAFSTLAGGYLSRPIGAILLGHFGDKIGRKAVLVLTLVAMGASTFLIGLLPTFDTIGIAAPIILVVLRLIQGLAVGGEWGGAVLIASENAPEGKKTFYAAFAQMGSPAGLLVATFIFTLLQDIVPSEPMLSWGWRIPFLIAGLLVPIGLIIRLSVDDAPEFKEASRRAESSKMPLLKLLREGWRGLIIGTGAFLGVFATYYLLTTFVITYATKTLGMSAAVVLPANIISAVFEAGGIVLGVWLAKKITAKHVALYSAIALGLWSWPAFALMKTAVPMNLYIAVAIAMIFVGTSYGVLAGEVAELFTPTQRYTGIGLNYHLSGALGGGLAPVAATSMLAATGSTNGVVIVCVVVAVIMTVCCALLPQSKTAKVDPVAESEGAKA